MCRVALWACLSHKRIHRLVADAFLGKHDDLVVNHINGNKLDNAVENLEWVTAKENSTKAAESGLYKTRPVRIIETGEEFNSIKDCAEAIDADPSDINHYFSGKINNLKGLHFEYIDDFKNNKQNIRNTPFLYPHQKDAIKKMFNGCVLNGTVGSGKSRTGLYY